MFISRQDLEKNGIFCNNTKVMFAHKIFIKGPSFAEIFREKAINYVKEYSDQGQDFLIVKNYSYFTIWLESKQDNIKEELPAPAIANPLIACIDDCKTVQRQVKSVLELVGYKVLNITDPVSSLNLLMRQQPALILLDINMPEINGYELCQMFRRSRKLGDIPIVMVTGIEGTIARIRAKLAGANHYLTKPFERNELISVVQQNIPIEEATK